MKDEHKWIQVQFDTWRCDVCHLECYAMGPHPDELKCPQVNIASLASEGE